MWSALEERFPDKVKHDHPAECLHEVLQLAAKEGENMASWCSRVQEMFAKCCRKVNVEFPSEARGWIFSLPPTPLGFRQVVQHVRLHVATSELTNYCNDVGSSMTASTVELARTDT